MREIVLYPDPVLRKKAKAVARVDAEIVWEIGDLLETLKAKENGAGLAAPQIGISKRFFAVKDKVYINPEIVEVFNRRKSWVKTVDDKGKEDDFLEGCLSFPGLFGTVKRWLRIGIKWQEIDGKKLVGKSMVLERFEAVVFQHELDHLEGILFVDHIKEDGGEMWKQQKDKMVRVKEI